MSSLDSTSLWVNGRELSARALRPARNLFEELGDMMILMGLSVSSTLCPPYRYGGQFVP